MRNYRAKALAARAKRPPNCLNSMQARLFYFSVLLYFSSLVRWLGVFNFMLLQFVHVPIFLSLGFFAASIVLYFGRGEKVIQLIVSASYVLAGVYFPPDVFPKVIKEVFSYSPFNTLIQSSRETLTGQATDLGLSFKLLISLVIGVTLLILSFKLFCYLITHVDRKTNHRPLMQ